MKTLSLWQPWASLIAAGVKRIETRGWATSYRGPLAIHAARRRPTDDDDDALDPLFLSRIFGGMQRADDEQCRRAFNRLPLGAIVCVATLADCRAIVGDNLGRGHIPGVEMSGDEELFGNYEPGRFGWLLTDVVRLAQPIPARGAQGLWDWTPPADFKVRS